MTQSINNTETYTAIPKQMKKLPHWVCWRSVSRGGDKPSAPAFPHLNTIPTTNFGGYHAQC